MMGILLVKNVIEINKKMSTPAKTDVPGSEVEPTVKKEADTISFVGTPIPEPVQEPVEDTKRICSACGRELSKNAVTFCEFCGNKLEN